MEGTKWTIDTEDVRIYEYCPIYRQEHIHGGFYDSFKEAKKELIRCLQIEQDIVKDKLKQARQLKQ